ncbi:MAG: DNA polymerase III subunit [bacterium]
MTRSFMPFPDIIGQERVCKILDRILASGIHLPLLFVGQPGVGKRTVALRFAQAANCETGTGSVCGHCVSCRRIANLTHPDIRLVMPIRKPGDEATPEKVIGEMVRQYPEYTIGKSQPFSPPNYQIPIAAVRWLTAEMAKAPTSARTRFFIILNAHQLNEQAQNALLKILEEPQRNTAFILTATNPSTLLSTIRSRCQSLRFSEIAEQKIVNYLQRIVAKDKENIFLAATLAQGSIGKALSALENPEAFIAQPVLDCLTTPNSEVRFFQLLNEVSESSLATAVNTALLLYHNSLRAHLGYPYLSQFSIPALTSCQIPLLKKKICYLYTRFHECQLNTNRLLSLYTLLSEASI